MTDFLRQALSGAGVTFYQPPPFVGTTAYKIDQKLENLAREAQKSAQPAWFEMVATDPSSRGYPVHSNVTAPVDYQPFPVHMLDKRERDAALVSGRFEELQKHGYLTEMQVLEMSLVWVHTECVILCDTGARPMKTTKTL
jgi:hypothetical protein